MVDLKLAKLPDRTPVKLTITIPPDLSNSLREYADVYRATYGEAESVGELVPFMLATFLNSDRAFANARKGGVHLEDVQRQPAVHKKSGGESG